MDKNTLKNTAERLVAPGKGLLAADESTGTIKKRLASIDVESTPETNRVYRQILFTAPEVEKYISGVILFDETIRQSTDKGVPFPKHLAKRGIIPGIKVDKGKIDMPFFPKEKVTEGLDGLKDRLEEYKKMGARFAKWRAVFLISEETPTDVCMETNAESLARYAALCQGANIVPIVEPEVLIDGAHKSKKAKEIGYRVLKVVFARLAAHRVYLEGLLLKPSMVVPGKESGEEMVPEKVAQMTLSCFKEVVPPEVPGIVFLSGGQTPKQATANLNALNKKGDASWELSFSYGRALQGPVLEAWQGKEENTERAQKAFLRRAKLNSSARKGEYSPEMENGD